MKPPLNHRTSLSGVPASTMDGCSNHAITLTIHQECQISLNKQWLTVNRACASHPSKKPYKSMAYDVRNPLYISLASSIHDAKAEIETTGIKAIAAKRQSANTVAARTSKAPA